MATPVDRLVKFGMQARGDLIEKYSVEENLADAIVTNNQEALVLALEESDRRFEKTIQESNQRFEEARQESNRRFAEIRADIKQEFGKVYERFDKVDQRINGIDLRLNGLEKQTTKLRMEVKNFNPRLKLASYGTAGLVVGMLIALDKLFGIVLVW